jgi:hypothetical protein
MRNMKIKCLCCGKKIEKYGNTKLCGRCSLFTCDLRNKVAYYKRQMIVLRKEKYGVKNGQERIRSLKNAD